MIQQETEGLLQCGRRISAEEIQQICETVQLFPHLSLSELTATICEHLGWYTAAGGLKEDACAKLLRKLEARGLLRLPQKLWRRAGRSSSPTVTANTDPGSPICCTLRELRGVWLQVVEGEQKRLWNEYVGRYHPLGYKQPFGYRMRYFVVCPQGTLGCLLFSGAAKALGVRDRWIGWTDVQRLQRLAWVVNLSRHLVFPWVQVPNLCSHVLAQLTRRIRTDWQARWGYQPVLVETFVDPRAHEGSCYRAAGWSYLGMTTGEGLVRPGHSYRTSPKMIFVRPLLRRFRHLLCSELPFVGEQP
jgi:hypothetical protein